MRQRIRQGSLHHAISARCSNSIWDVRRRSIRRNTREKAVMQRKHSCFIVSAQVVSYLRVLYFRMATIVNQLLHNYEARASQPWSTSLTDTSIATTLYINAINTCNFHNEHRRLTYTIPVQKKQKQRRNGVKSSVGKFTYTTLFIYLHHAVSPMNKAIRSMNVSVQVKVRINSMQQNL